MFSANVLILGFPGLVLEKAPHDVPLIAPVIAIAALY